ncbi:lycopene cyclase domain-containing protein [Flavobacterium frigoris]|uniref:Lycopene cyclase domain-containing protein n=1 Tax=Flavobacterium frigoris TaxID=229204 RepID=A0A1H9DTE5_FLAFI|nr:lycopene cyclase domain-containing protein [Flavobacterium frigoris]
MIKRELMIQSRWLLFALVISLVLVCGFDGTVVKNGSVSVAQHTFLGLNLFLEILIFFVFSTFVVFGIKGFFEMYAQKTSNVIIFISGVLLTFVIFGLCYQILFQE